MYTVKHSSVQLHQKYILKKKLNCFGVRTLIFLMDHKMDNAQYTIVLITCQFTSRRHFIQFANYIVSYLLIHKGSVNWRKLIITWCCEWDDKDDI